MPPAAPIGLVFDYSEGYCRGVVRGIKRYAESKPDWALLPIDAEPGAVEALAKLPPQGLIAWAYQGPILDALKGLRHPWINVCGVPPEDRRNSSSGPGTLDTRRIPPGVKPEVGSENGGGVVAAQAGDVATRMR
jgi:hypothetical protein